MTNGSAAPPAGARFLRGGPPRRIQTRGALLLIGACGLLLLLVSPLAGENGLGAYFRLRAEKRELEARVEALRRESAELEARIEALKNDPAALEEYVRTNHGMIAPGEKVLQVIVRDEPEPMAPR